MTIPKFRKWLQQHIAYLTDIDEHGQPDRHPFELRDEAYRHAADLGLHTCLAAYRKRPLECLVAMLDAIPSSLTPPVIARRLGVSSDTVRSWCINRTLKASNVGKGRNKWLIKEDDLQAFLQLRQPQPKITHKPKTRSKRY